MIKGSLTVKPRSHWLRLCVFLLGVGFIVNLTRRSSDDLWRLVQAARLPKETQPESETLEAGLHQRQQHPIKRLVESAENRFNHLLQRQSRTLESAVQTYIRRYRRSPPPGFDAWFEYAVAQGSPIIDDYDVLDAAISPLLARSGQEVSESIEAAVQSEASIWLCRIRNGAMKPGCEAFGEDILRLFADARILSKMPNVDLVVNALDEPRVLLDNSPVSRIRRRQQFEWFDLSHASTWEQLVMDPCRQLSEVSARNGPEETESPLIDTYEIRMVQNQSHALDLCQHSEYESLSGFFSSPDTLRVTRAPLPILSPAVPSTMADIPFPALAYNNDMYAYDERESVPWENKTHGLYWAGKNTGSFQSKNGGDWRNHHRQRFVSMANYLEPKFYTYLEMNDDMQEWETVEDEYLNTTSYNVHFTGLTQCEREACEAQKKYFGLHVDDTRGEALEYTLTFDLDGNGHSGRYYRLLESFSLPLKQTIFREWHDDRLIPWYHFVPISMEMEELPEVVRYFVEEDEGRELARSLAMNGRRWMQKALTPEQQVVYMYRLMLEVARLQDPDRRPTFK